jgi:hypothetical protein
MSKTVRDLEDSQIFEFGSDSKTKGHRGIVAVTGYEPSTVFYELTQVLSLKFGHWR